MQNSYNYNIIETYIALSVAWKRNAKVFCKGKWALHEKYSNYTANVVFSRIWIYFSKNSSKRAFRNTFYNINFHITIF